MNHHSVKNLLFCAVFTAAAITGTVWAEDRAVILTANELSAAGGNPSLVSWRSKNAAVPVWSFSGGTTGQSAAGMIPAFSDDCRAVKAEIQIIAEESAEMESPECVFSVHFGQIADGREFPVRKAEGDPVRAAVKAPFIPQTVTLESYYAIEPGLPIAFWIERHPDDPADTFTRPIGLIQVKISPVEEPMPPLTVEDRPGYNSWPMIQAIGENGEKLVVVYSRGSGHTIDEDLRAVYARTSLDGGKTWTEETTVTNEEGCGEVTVGKGLDSKGQLLVWVRQIGSEFRQALFRSADGVSFEKIAVPELAVMPMQITDIFTVPGVGLMALWFAGPYNDEGPAHSWGTVVSADDGMTWTQNVIESNLPKEDWPTEQGAAYLGNGRIIALARTENGGANTLRSQLLLYSADSGTTWSRARTNITDVLASTPTLQYDAENDLLTLYYYHRGRGVLRCRTARPDDVIEHPLSWPDSFAAALGSDSTFDAGNVNSTRFGKDHALAFYSGKGSDTAVIMTVIPAPGNAENSEK